MLREESLSRLHYHPIAASQEGFFSPSALMYKTTKKQSNNSCSMTGLFHCSMSSKMLCDEQLPLMSLKI